MKWDLERIKAWIKANPNSVVNLILVSIGLVGFIYVTSLFIQPEAQVPDRVIDYEAQQKALAAKTKEVNIEGELITYKPFPGFRKTDDWPQFRGPKQDNIVKTKSLNFNWKAKPPKVLWQKTLGEGHSGAVVWGGMVYVLDYDEEYGGDALRCFDLATGEEYWQRRYKVKIKRNHGISRTVPVIRENLLISIGPKCQILAVDPKSGVFKWGLDMVQAFETQVPMWYTGQCPIIDDENNEVIIAPGGDFLMAGLDLDTGELKWGTKNPMAWQMSHASIVSATYDGVEMYIYPAIGGVYGILAKGEERGKLLWKSGDWTSSVVAPSANPLSPEHDEVFLTGGYGMGSIKYSLHKNGEVFDAEKIYKLPTKTFACEQQTPIYYKDKIFAVLPKDAGTLKQQFACLSVDGTLAWTSGKTARFGLGPFMLINDHFIILSDDGRLSLAKASTQKYDELATLQLIENGIDAWAPMAFAEGKLLLRDSTRLYCIDLSL